MAFNIRQFAKNALLSAQTALDNALDIQEGDESDGSESNNEQDENASTCHTESKIDEAETLSGGFLDINLNDEENSTEGNWNVNDKIHAVVDTEPNPIRDTHETPSQHTFHYSPNSNSPDEEESSQNGRSSNTLSSVSIINAAFELATAGSTDFGSDNGAFLRSNASTSDRTLDDHGHYDQNEDIRTIASSDIEVIKHMDDWSVTSSNTNPAAMMETCAATFLHDSLSESLNSDSSDELTVLKAKIQHKDKKIEELCRVIENLKSANSTLLFRNKQFNKASAVAEENFHKQLKEKIKEIENLAGGAKKMSELNIRQSKEIKRLKQQVKQFDVIVAARDSALKELQDAHKHLLENAKIISQTKENCENLERERNNLINDLQIIRNEKDSANQCMLDSTTQLEQTKLEAQRLEKALSAGTRTKEELERENRSLSAKLLSKTAHETIVDEREKGLIEDLKAERSKTSGLLNRIRELEKRLEDMQHLQREFAAEIQSANSPLLINIASLEEKVVGLERQNELLTRQLRASTDALNMQKKKHDETSLLLSNMLEEERHRNNLKAEEISKYQSERIELLEKLKNLNNELANREKANQTKMKKLERQVKALTDDISSKQSEILHLTKEQHELKRFADFSISGSLVGATSTSRLPGSDIAENNDVTSPFESLKTTERDGISPTKSEQQRKIEVHQINVPLPEMGVQDYQIELSSIDHLRSELENAQNELFQVRKRFDRLLEMYGGCLETIEELKLDNDDLRSICKEQALQLCGQEENKNLEKFDE